MTKNGQNMAKMEKIRNIQMTDNKEDKFFYFPMILCLVPAPGTRLLPTVYMLPGVVFLFARTKKMGGCLGQKCCLLFVCVLGGV